MATVLESGCRVYQCFSTSLRIIPTAFTAKFTIKYTCSFAALKVMEISIRIIGTGVENLPSMYQKQVAIIDFLVVNCI